MKSVLLGKLLANALAAEAVVPVGNGLAVVVNAIEGDMNMRMLPVEMPSNDVLRILDAYFRVSGAVPWHG